jgi:hypothetical protein
MTTAMLLGARLCLIRRALTAGFIGGTLTAGFDWLGRQTMLGLKALDLLPRDRLFDQPLNFLKLGHFVCAH